jgi:Tfp pilus assembly protein PilN
VFQERYTKILLVIFKKDIVTGRYDIIKKAGYKTGRAVLASEPEAKVFFDMGPNKISRETVAMVDVDAGFSNFTVINEGKAIYMRSIPLGTRELSKREKEGLSAFSEEIKRSLEAYQANNINDAPSKIFFIGKKNIVGEIVRDHKSSGSWPEAEVFDVFSSPSTLDAGRIEGSEEVSVLSVAAPVLEPEKDYVDLTPEDIRIRHEIKKKSKEALKAGILATTTLLLFCVALLSNLMLKNMYMNKLEKSFSSENEEVLKLNEVIDSTSRIKKFISGKGAGLSGMAFLFRAMPDEVFLTSIDFRNGDTFTFTGTADSMSRVFSLVTELENSNIFRDVKVDFTRSRSQRGTEVADFGLTLTFEREVA